MDKVKFKSELRSLIGNVIVLTTTVSRSDTDNLPISCWGCNIISYEILLIFKEVNKLRLDISVLLRDGNDSWVTILQEDYKIAVGFYAFEDPDKIVWDKRVWTEQKAEMVRCGIDMEIRNLIRKVHQAYLKS